MGINLIFWIMFPAFVWISFRCKVVGHGHHFFVLLVNLTDIDA